MRAERQELVNLFKYCLNVLRDNDHVTDDEALRSSAHLLDLRSLEPQFKDNIDMTNATHYDLSSSDDDIVEKNCFHVFTSII